MPRSTELSVQQLYTFVQVFQLGGYAAAARSLELSVPTVWQQIQAIERLYGASLFEKHGRGIEPTKLAKLLHDQFSEILAGLDSTFDLVHHAEDAQAPITLVSGVRMLMEDLAAPLERFRRGFDNRIVIRHGDNRVAEELVLSGEADLALTLEAGHEKNSPLIHYEPAYFVEFLAVAAPKHPFALAPKHSLRELVRHDLIVTTSGTHGRAALDQALHRERLKAQIAIETDNSGFTIACARAGLGVGILAGHTDGQLCRNLAVHSMRRQLGRRQIVFMWKKGRRLNEPLLRLTQEIKAAHAR